MKKMFLIALLSGLVSCKQNSTVCEIKSLKMLGAHEKVLGFGTGLEHYILIDGFSRSCLDSNLIVSAALKYRDTIGIGKYDYPVAMPANVLRFYNSDKDFMDKDASSDNKKLNRSCLVTITFGYFNKPNQYVFYNNKGDVIYSGNKWLR